MLPEFSAEQTDRHYLRRRPCGDKAERAVAAGPEHNRGRDRRATGERQRLFTRGGQIYLISPLGGEPVQATSLPVGATKPWWDPSGDYIYCVSGNAIWRTNVIEGDAHFGESEQITDPTLYPGRSPDALCVAPNGQWIAFNRSLNRGDGVSVNQIFIAAIPLQ